MMKKNGINDVAHLAGVSISTVSRVANNNYPVSEAVRRKVESAIKELNYTPHALASNLKSGNSRIIGVISPRITNPAIMQMVKSIEEIVELEDYCLFISSTDNDITKEHKLLKHFNERMVDLVLIGTSSNDGAFLKKFQDEGMPIIMVDRYISGFAIDSVRECCFEASYDIVRYMTNRGHKRIMTTNPLSNIQLSIDRYRGYLAALEAAGIEADPHLVLSSDFSRAKAYSQMKTYLASHARVTLPTGIFVASGHMAEGIIKAIIEAGLNIPNDISVTTYGQVWSHQIFFPKITCVFQQYDLMGKEAGKLALRRLTEIKAKRVIQSGFEKIVVPTYILEGDSVANLQTVSTNNASNTQGRFITR